MLVITDSPDFARHMIDGDSAWVDYTAASVDAGLYALLRKQFGKCDLYSSELTTSDKRFRHLLITASASRSQYDIAVELCKENADIPDSTLCLAGSGENFHGQRDRSWSSPNGNIYLTAIFAPNRKIDQFGPGFIMLPAIAVVEAADSIQGLEGRSSIKWVNDILINNAKIAGVLTYTQAMGDDVTGVVLGIGLNVEVLPDVEPTPFVPDVACLSDFVDDFSLCNRKTALDGLIQSLDSNYRLLENGEYEQLLFKYRRRSAVIGKHVIICKDNARLDSEVIAEGIVTDIGYNLELLIEGHEKPVTRGRLIIKD
jgi:biotin-[acetyl-CoA-carboxylase] ligase BirA-like protein